MSGNNDTNTRFFGSFYASAETAVHRVIETLATVKNYRRHAIADPETQAENVREYRRSLRLLRFLYCRKRNKKASLLQAEQRVIDEARP